MGGHRVGYDLTVVSFIVISSFVLSCRMSVFLRD